MPSKLLLVPVFVAAVGLAPAAAFAQQMPVNPDGTSMDEAPAAVRTRRSTPAATLPRQPV